MGGPERRLFLLLPFSILFWIVDTYNLKWHNLCKNAHDMNITEQNRGISIIKINIKNGVTNVK